MEQRIINEVKRHPKYEASALLAFIEVETGGKGFDEKTGRILIQFEPVWFRRYAPYAPSGKWSVNKVDVQSKEWEAFSNAFSINKKSAMLSTSIGLGQIMGLHYHRLGYPSVDAMWDDAKSGIEAQVRQLVGYIDGSPDLQLAIKLHDWKRVARLYNGKNYMQISRKYGRVPYDLAMRDAYKKYKNI